jgi:ketosteroid isomerase-like protein
MSERPTALEPVELTRRLVAASGGADVDAVIGLCAEDAVWDVHPWGLGTHRGLAAIRRFLEAWIGSFDEYQTVTEEVHEFGSGVVLAVVTQYAGSARSRTQLQLRSATVLVWTDGLAERVTHYRDVDEARAVAERLAEERQ